MSLSARTGLALVLSLAVLTGCSGEVAAPDALTTPAPTAAAPASDGVARASAPPVAEPVEQDLDLAVSEPREDSVYPDVGDPRVDALHYDLDLTWEPGRERLTGRAVVTFRAARTAPRFQLDLGAPLAVEELTLDGEAVRFTRRGKDLLVQAPITADDRHELAVDYSGTPEPAPAPTTRSDFSTTGFTVTDTGEVWTMQEPYGAYTWYPVNDQPSDKALYDVTVHAPAPWTGISNGALTELTTDEDGTTTSWQLAEPASSYLITLAIGDYAHAGNTTEDGLRVDYWTPRGMVRRLEGSRAPRPPSTGSRTGSATTPSTPSASSSRPPRARWRPRRWSPWATTTTSCPHRSSPTSSCTSGTATRSRRPTGATCGSTRA